MELSFFHCSPALIDLQDEMLRQHMMCACLWPFFTILRPNDTVPSWFFQFYPILGEFDNCRVKLGDGRTKEVYDKWRNLSLNIHFS